MAVTECIAPGTQVELITGLQAWVDAVILSKDGTIYRIIWQDDKELKEHDVRPYMIADFGNLPKRSMNLIGG